MKSSKVLITGISGMLGSAIYNYLKEKPEYTIYGVSRQQGFRLDKATIITGDLASGMTYLPFEGMEDFDCVIHCSAEVNLNLCEEDKIHAFNANVLATEMVFSKVKSAKYFYISTDSIFNGITGNYVEESIPDPLNYYAKSKLEGEYIARETRPQCYIIRTNIFGFVLPLKKSLFEWAFQELSNVKPIGGFTNVFFNPLYVYQLAEVLYKLHAGDFPSGIYNCTSNESISKYEFLVRIANRFNLDRKLIQSAELDPTKYSVNRALNTTLNNTKIKSMLPELNLSIDAGIEALYTDFENNN